MARFLVDFIVTTAVFFPVFLLVFTALWRLKAKGWYTVLLGFVCEIVFLFLALEFAPTAVLYHKKSGMSPVESGIAMGCAMPMIFMTLYYLSLRRKGKRGKTPDNFA